MADRSFELMAAVDAVPGEAKDSAARMCKDSGLELLIFEGAALRAVADPVPRLRRLEAVIDLQEAAATLRELPEKFPSPKRGQLAKVVTQSLAGRIQRDFRTGREVAWVPLHVEHPAEVVGHRLPLPVSELAGHLVVLPTYLLPLSVGSINHTSSASAGSATKGLSNTISQFSGNLLVYGSHRSEKM
jgi:hypothetical protein